MGAWLGLTTRRCQSGEVDYDGHISRRGDAHARPCRVRPTRLGLRLKDKLGFKRAAVAGARKLAVIMHAMLVSGQRFDRSAGLASATG